MESENPVMTFPIKKGISAKLLIDRRAELYIHKWGQNFLADWKRVKMLAPRPTKGGNDIKP